MNQSCGADDCLDGTGDVNKDGTLNILDLQSIIMHIIAEDMYSFTPEMNDIADYNQTECNAEINIIDIIKGKCRDND